MIIFADNFQFLYWSMPHNILRKFCAIGILVCASRFFSLSCFSSLYGHDLNSASSLSSLSFILFWSFSSFFRMQLHIKKASYVCIIIIYVTFDLFIGILLLVFNSWWFMELLLRIFSMRSEIESFSFLWNVLNSHNEKNWKFLFAATYEVTIQFWVNYYYYFLQWSWTPWATHEKVHTLISCQHHFFPHSKERSMNQTHFVQSSKLHFNHRQKKMFTGSSWTAITMRIFC